MLSHKTQAGALSVRLVTLEPLRVASLIGRGKTPELAGWKALLDWGRAQGLLKAAPAPRFFGFNVRRADHIEHDYEVWMTVGPQVQSDSIVTVKDFPGGRYAVARVKGVEQIPGTWMRFTNWLKTSSYQYGEEQWLEEHVQFIDLPEDELVLDLYLPLQA
ncbi:MAG: GyrI-like domain-containing protein [Chloroflexi bacterium]|nr:GyrI-like domain-containing protein [Chloroflexota bacterium]